MRAEPRGGLIGRGDRSVLQSRAAIADVRREGGNTVTAIAWQSISPA
jgi:hypothetical protein